jgi:general secretion pathway protein J
MKPVRDRISGFTLIELLVALLVLSILALTSYRGLGAVLDARDRVAAETEKWRSIAAFFARIERDMQLAVPRTVRNAAGDVPPWVGRSKRSEAADLEFSRSAPIDAIDSARRTGYRLADNGDIELWLWPGLDVASAPEPTRIPVLKGIAELKIQYMNNEAIWVEEWPAQATAGIPRAVRLRLVLESREELVRVFALKP